MILDEPESRHSSPAAVGATRTYRFMISEMDANSAHTAQDRLSVGLLAAWATSVAVAFVVGCIHTALSVRSQRLAGSVLSRRQQCNPKHRICCCDGLSARSGPRHIRTWTTNLQVSITTKRTFRNVFDGGGSPDRPPAMHASAGGEPRHRVSRL
jgi:hypothetical protein